MSIMNEMATDGRLSLSTMDAAAVEALACSLAAADRTVDDLGWIADARLAWDEFPLTLRRRLRQFRRDPGSAGTLLLRGVPVPGTQLPPTPMVSGSVQRTPTVPAAVLVMLACGLGDPAAYRAEKSGAIVQDVVPVRGREEVQGNEGSVRLSFHNENAFHPHRPDYVLLLCLRPDPTGVAGLRTASAREVLPGLDAGTRDALRSCEYITAAPPSFGSGNGVTPAHAVLSGAPEDPDLRVDLAATRGVTPRATAALFRLGELFEETACSIRLRAGDLAIVDNRVTVHGRTAFRPRYDGTDRWLQRTFVMNDLRRSRAARDGDGYVLVR